jgi:hypothetical protein
MIYLRLSPRGDTRRGAIFVNGGFALDFGQTRQSVDHDVAGLSRPQAALAF